MREMEVRISCSRTIRELREVVSGIETFLSPNVYDLVANKGVNTTKPDDKGEATFLTSWGLIDLERFRSHMDYQNEDEKFSRSWFETRIIALSAIACEAHTWVCCSSRREASHLVELCSWLRNRDAVTSCVAQVKDAENTETGVVEGVLLITARMDRALGNLYRWKSPGKPVPFLIRDLLLTNELREILGSKLLLMGNPLSLNLRNLAWHGFIYPGELSAHYLSLLLLTAATIGDLISFDVPERPCIKLAHPDPVFPALIKHSYWAIVKVLFSSSPYIHEHSRPLWNLALRRFYEGKYGNCLSLIIPQLENLLRCIFAVVNERPSSVLTAKCDVLYITLDVILSDSYTEETVRKNHLVEIIGKRALLGLRDLFSFVEGPRLRDRLSHGECKLDELDETLTNHVLALIAALLLNFEERELTCKEVRLIRCLNSYEPRFHPVALLREELLTALSLTASSMNRISHIASELQVNCENKECFHLVVDDNAINEWLNETSIDTSSQLRDQLLQLGLEYSENYALVPSYRRIVQDVILGLTNLNKAIDDSFVEFKNRTLRSRQRVTFNRMLSSCPLYVLASKVCLVPCILYLMKPPAQNHLTPKDKQFKVLCKYAGNLASLTRSDKNRWLELADCAQSVLLQHSR